MRIFTSVLLLALGINAFAQKDSTVAKSNNGELTNNIVQLQTQLKQQGIVADTNRIAVERLRQQLKSLSDNMGEYTKLALSNSLQHLKSQDQINLLQVNIQNLQNETKALSDSLALISKAKTETEKARYLKNYQDFTTSANIALGLKAIYQSCKKDHAADDLLKVMRKLNRGDSAVLGFSYARKLAELADAPIGQMKDLKDDDKKIFVFTLDKAVNALSAGSTPTELTDDVIFYLTTFVPSRNPVKDQLGDAFVGNFKTAIADYIAFYADLDANNASVDLDLTLKNAKYASLPARLDASLKTLAKAINIDSNVTDQSSALFQYSKSGSVGFKYSDFNDNPKIRNVIESKAELKRLTADIYDYATLSQQLTDGYFDSSLVLLGNAKKLGGANTTKIDGMIENYKAMRLGKLQPSGDRDDTGFDKRYNDAIKAIMAYLVKFE